MSFAEVVDKEGVREAIEAADIGSLPDGAWIRGAGWDIAAFPDGTAAILDEFTGERPMFVGAVDGHSGWANSAALKAAGIDASTKDPEGGRIERDAAGNPTGLLRESAMELVSSLLPPYPDSQVDAGFADGPGRGAELRHHGDHRPFGRRLDARRLQARRRGGEPRAAGRGGGEDRGGGRPGRRRAGARMEGPLRFRPDLKVTSAKLFVDGVIETGTAALLEAYVGSNESGDLLFTPEQIDAIAIAADKAGLQLHAHAIGDRAVRVALDAYEAAQKANGVRDSRHQITHLELIDPADIPRFKPLGVVANIQALWAYPDTYITDLTEPKIGPERSEWLYPFGALKQAGATLVGSSDWSVSSMNPLEAIQTGVTRQDIEDPAGRVLTPQHKLDVMDMLKAYTVNAAYAAFDEANSGTLTAGKRADIVVLDRDITAGPATDIAKGSVLATLIDGDIVYEGEGMPEPVSP